MIFAISRCRSRQPRAARQREDGRAGKTIGGLKMRRTAKVKPFLDMVQRTCASI